MANSEERIRDMLDEVNIGEEDRQYIMEQARQKRAYLTVDAEEKAEMIQAMKGRNVDHFRRVLEKHFATFHMNGSTISLLDHKCNVMSDVDVGLYDEAKIFCYAFENLSTLEELEKSKEMVVELKGRLPDATGPHLINLRSVKNDSPTFWYNLMNKVKLAKEIHYRDAVTVELYEDFEDFLYEEMGQECETLLRLAFALLAGNHVEAAKLAKKAERSKNDLNEIDLRGLTPYSMEGHGNDERFNISWIALMAANVEVLTSLKVVSNCQVFRFELSKLYRFYLRHCASDVLIELEKFLDVDCEGVRLAKLYVAAEKQDIETAKEILETFTCSRLPTEYLDLPLRNMPTEGVCKDISLPRGKQECCEKSLFVFAIEIGFFDLLKLLLDEGFRPYTEFVFKHPPKPKALHDRLLVFASVCYWRIKKDLGKRTGITDLLLSEPIRSYVTPLILFYAAHMLDDKFIKEITLRCGSKVGNDKIDEGMSAYHLAFSFSTCKDLDKVLSLLKGTTGGQGGSFQLDPETLLSLPEKEMLEQLESYDFNQVDRTKEDTILATALKKKVSFAKYVLIKDKLKERNPAELDASSIHSLIRALFNHCDEDFIDKFFQDEDVIDAKRKADEADDSMMCASIESFLNRSYKEKDTCLSTCVEPFMATFSDNIMLYMKLDRLRRLAFNMFHAKQTNTDCQTLYDKMKEKLLTWCQANADLWPISVTNWLTKESMFIMAQARPPSEQDSYLMQIVTAQWDVIEYIKDNDESLFRSQNAIGMNLLMHFADSNVILGHFKGLLNTGLFDVNAVTQVNELAKRFDLQHLAGASVSAKKQKNSVLVQNELVKAKRVMVKNPETGDYDRASGSFPGQEKYVSKNKAALVGIPEEESSHIMVTARSSKRSKDAEAQATKDKKVKFSTGEQAESELLEQKEEGIEMHERDPEKDDIDTDYVDEEIMPEDALTVSNIEGSISSTKPTRPAPEGLEDTPNMSVSEKINMMKIETKTPMVPEHFDKQSVKSDKQSSGFFTKKNKYKFAPDTSTKGFTTDSSVQELLSLNYCEKTNVLLLAIKAKHQDKAEYLLKETNVDVYHKDASQSSALSLIVRNFCSNTEGAEIVKLVLRKMDKKTVKEDKDAEKMTAKMIAEKMEFSNIVELITTFKDFEKNSLQLNESSQLVIDGFLFNKSGQVNKKKEQKWQCSKCELVVTTTDNQDGSKKLLGKHVMSHHKD